MPDPNLAPAALVRPPANSWLADLAGSLNAATTSFTVAVCAGAIVFAPLGPGYLPHGVVASLFATVLGGTIASLMSTSPTMLSCPRAASCIVLAGFVAALHRTVPDLPPTTIIALTGLTACTAGALQMLGAALRIGRLARFVPFPVVSGFTHGIAITLFLSFLPLFLGMGEVPKVALPSLDGMHPWALAVSGASLAAVLVFARVGPRLPAIFIGMLAGAAASMLLRALVPGVDTGAHIEPAIVPPLYSPFVEWASVPAALRDPDVPRLVVSFAVALAAVASIDSVIAAVALESRFHVPTRPDRDLLAQGLGNVVSGAFGGIAISISNVSGQAALEHGAVRRYIPVVTALLIVLTGIAGATFLDSLPLAVLAALMVYISRRLADPWGIALVRMVATSRRRLDPVAKESFAVYLLVVLAILLLDIVAALAVGLIVSSVVFIRTINQHVLRRVTTGSAVRSRRHYPPAVTTRLAQALDAVAVLELDGPLFFGTADRIAIEVERLAAKVRFVVIDLHRAQALDATATAVLARTHARLTASGRRLVLAGKPRGLVAGHVTLPDAFPDRDRAVEWIEGQLIAEMDTEAVETPMEPASVAPRLGLTTDEGSMILGITEIRQFPAGSTVFAEGDPSNELYYLLSGRLSIFIGLDTGNGRRVVTFLPGNSFGDVAFLDGRPRTASAVCEEACAVLVISRPAVEALARTAPDLVAKVFGALALDLAGRLRHADRLLRDEMDG